jgi:peptide/nickel transport system substrate-binding protein
MVQASEYSSASLPVRCLPRGGGISAGSGSPLGFDPAKARALLKEAGYGDGFSVTLDYAAGQPGEAIAQAVAAMLSRVGVRATPQPWLPGIYFPKLDRSDTSLCIFDWTPGTYAWYGLAPLVHTPGEGRIMNIGKYSSAAVDRLIDQIKVEMNTDTRVKLIHEVLLKANADVAYVPLVRRAVVWAMRPNVKVVPSPQDTLELRWVNVQ